MAASDADAAKESYRASHANANSEMIGVHFESVKREIAEQNSMSAPKNDNGEGLEKLGTFKGVRSAPQQARAPRTPLAIPGERRPSVGLIRCCTGCWRANDWLCAKASAVYPLLQSMTATTARTAAAPHGLSIMAVTTDCTIAL